MISFSIFIYQTLEQQGASADGQPFSIQFSPKIDEMIARRSTILVNIESISILIFHLNKILSFILHSNIDYQHLFQFSSHILIFIN